MEYRNSKTRAMRFVWSYLVSPNRMEHRQQKHRAANAITARYTLPA